MIPIYYNHSYHHPPIGRINDDNEIEIYDTDGVPFNAEQLIDWLKEGRYELTPGYVIHDNLIKIMEMSFVVNPLFKEVEKPNLKQCVVDRLDTGDA